MALVVRTVKVLAIPARWEECLGAHTQALATWQLVAIVRAGSLETLVMDGTMLKVIRI
jgi:hypothetical protein